MAELRFPDGFLWGTATASYQVEGAVREDGRGESIWDRFSHTPGKTFEGQTGDVACDHYHRYPEDVEHMARMGMNAYRFSVAWPRIFPEGKGPVNQKGLDFYRRLVDALQGRHIQPCLTLYHWDLPQALQEKGGWDNRDTGRYFAEYAHTLYQALGDRVPLWITLNEPWVAAILGHAFGQHAPGFGDFPLAMRVVHHLLLAHGWAVEAFRHDGPRRAQIGITLNLSPVEPATGKEADGQAADLADRFTNRLFLDPIFRGAYPELPDLMRSALPQATPEEMERISTPVDFLGVNYYTRQVVEADPQGLYGVGMVPARGDLTEMGWEVYPQGLYDLLIRVHREYHPQAVYVTENGAAFADEIQDGEVDDPRRIAYVREHLSRAHAAIGAGVPLKGYFYWSLMDNFEWAFGYSKRFGLLYVVPGSLERVWKRSARWYAQVAQANAVPLG
ncbi:GH1 family beta-glucosidase [Limnochorda pilosa]|uniref:Beta-glucosidase n=1 Tax=Limnochorda pilosa TaxID=1555112 RepID=A0A0K2SK68_LIMPI|nr:GH1 family beta-glucosidase [Limnochorda pilosa]BAS27224.1 beta-glucosidase [Limnochorda pilosa]